MGTDKFFDKYPEFQKTSVTSPASGRLNARHSALIKRHEKIIKDAVCLDLGSHDGRWTFAALHAGARHVTGIEGREYLVANARRTFDLYDVDKKSFGFTVGDINKELSNHKKNEFDIVFIFGILYHVRSPFDLLQKVKDLNPKHIIVDSTISASENPIIELRYDDTGNESHSIDTVGNKLKVIVGYPSESAIFMMLEELGYSVEKIDYTDMDIGDWTDIQDYKDGIRVSALAVSRRLIGAIGG